VLAVIDGGAMAQTFGAVAQGLAEFREDVRVYGAAANRIGGEYHAQLLRRSLPNGIEWLGALPNDPVLALPGRHLGLVSAGELADLDARIDALADAWSRNAEPGLPPPARFKPAPSTSIPHLLEGSRIAVARDDAFCFIYPANLDLLREAGADLRFFSPIAGDALPGCDAVWLPGGYPELHLQVLSQRSDLHAALRAHVMDGRPLLAECGGLLFALDRLACADGDAASMAGLLRGRAVVHPRLAALGLQEVALPEGTLRGHTFHHARADIEAIPIATAVNPNGAPSCEAVYRERRFTASFVHFYFPSNPEAAVRLFLP
jgi:cobyrinic acid a,c-diamide synthase